MSMSSRSVGRLIRSVGFMTCVCATLMLSGCAGGGTGDGPAPDARAFAAQARKDLEDATAGHASEHQLTILREAFAAGEVTYDQAKDATYMVIECIHDAGGTAEYEENRDDSGFVIPNAILTAPDDDALEAMSAIAEQCSNREAFWVNKLYQLQPTSQETRDRYWLEQAPAIRQCLEDHGFPTSSDATPKELRVLALRVLDESGGETNCVD